MLVEQFLTEVKLGTDPEIDRLFNSALEQVFSKQYLNKIESKIKHTIKIKYKDLPGSSPTANVGRIIEIDKRKFDKLASSVKIKYLLHEFIHILQVSKSFLIFKSFKELSDLTNVLYKIFNDNNKKTYSSFLTGQTQDIGSGGKYEILAYLMNDSLDPSALSNTGRKLFKEAIVNSKIFNINNKFWVKRLSKF